MNRIWTYRPLKTALSLGLFSLLMIGLIGLLFHSTREQVAENKYQALLLQLKQVIPAYRFDNDLVQDSVLLAGQRIYRARYQGKAVAALITSTVQGYNGKIELLIALSTQAKIMGVRILSHHETPGLGDKIELKKSNWILNFTDIPFSEVLLKQWAVKRDGGKIDQFTGATITPRAVVLSIKQSLQFFLAHQTEIFQ